MVRTIHFRVFRQSHCVKVIKFPTFRRNLLPPKHLLNLKKEASNFFETSLISTILR
jgi:hypothetical protein